MIAAAAMVSLNSFSQDLIARQAPIDRKLKSVDSLALQKQIRAEQSEYPALSLYPNWNKSSTYMLTERMLLFPDSYTIDLTGFHMPTPSTVLHLLSVPVGEECTTDLYQSEYWRYHCCSF